MEEQKYYDFKDILNFLGFEFEFNRKHHGYPFTQKRDTIDFCWGQILIPKYGISETVQNKISDIKETPIKEIKMMYQVPFTVADKGCGLINKDISLSFRYDKEYKLGDVSKSIYECCFWIIENASQTNDFYIIKDDKVQEFFSYYIIGNQWGLGSLEICSSPNEKF